MGPQPEPTPSHKLQSPGFGFTFFYYFTVATLIGAIAVSQVLDLSFTSPLPARYGMLFALPIALWSAYWNRSQQLEVSFENSKAFQHKLNATLQDYGYQPDEAPEQDDGWTYWIYRRTGIAGLTSGKLFVAIAQNNAILAGRTGLMKTLRDRI
jgi:hypothetical protein